MKSAPEKRLAETAIFNAIEYAMRHEPVAEWGTDEMGEFKFTIEDPHSLQPFVKCLLRELEVIS